MDTYTFYNNEYVTDGNSSQDLSIICNGKTSCWQMTVFCPANKKCNVQCVGRQSCDSLNIIGGIGTILSINASGEYVLKDANIVCPPDYLDGALYTNNAYCRIMVNGSESLRGIRISSTDSWNSIDLKCLSPPCASSFSSWDATGSKLFCGPNLENSCFIEPKSSDQIAWRCKSHTHFCEDLTTPHPTSSPSLSPTFSPSQAPTSPPSNAPTDDCPALSVAVSDEHKGFKWRFDGLYTRITEQNETPYWEVPQLKDDKYIEYAYNDSWRLNGEGDGHYLDVYDRLFLQKLKADETNWWWQYSQDAQQYSVSIKCIGSISPTAAPSFSPTRSPSTSPTSKPTMDPTIEPTEEPTIDPTEFPSNAPSFSPSLAPSNPPTAHPSRAPTSLSDYDSFMNVNYVIGDIDWKQVTLLAQKNGDYKFNQTINADIVNLIESAYVNLDWTLHFSEFFVEIEFVKGFKITDLSKKKRPDIPLTDDCWREDNACTLTLKSKLYCSTLICDYIFDKFPTHETQFETAMTVSFIDYLYPNGNISENDNIWFAVESISEPLLIDPPITKWFTKYEYWIIIFVGIVIIVIILMFFFFKHRIKKMRNKKAFVVRNPMVLLISIGKYGPDIDDTHKNDIYEQLHDLPGIENDTLHMTQLFETRLGYEVYPKVDDNGCVRIIWNERDFKEFIEERARYLLNNIDEGKKYDSLVLIISCHGIPDYLLMSDHRKYSKLAVQRTFSFWPKLREIPRFILYDCCSGDQGRETTLNVDVNSDAQETQQKKVDESDIFDGTENHKYWIDDDQNPDHKLARVNAANAGFTSNLNRLTGSFLIYKMFNKYKDALDGKRTPFPFIHEVFDEIQTELQQEGKQLPESVWNDNTRYLVFKRRDVAHNVIESNDVDIVYDNEEGDTQQQSTKI